MKTRNKIAAAVRGLPKPFNGLLCRILSRAGLMSSWNHWYAKMGCPTKILAGIFAGMNYGPVAHGSQLLPKLLGTYEKELSQALEKMIGEMPDLVVDVGSAEGYYAVGMALALPRARILAYDINPAANRQLILNATINGVQDRVEARGACTPGILEAAISGASAPLIISDCEGYEFDLLDPVIVPALKRCSMIVEIHPDESTRILDGFLDKFCGSHKIAKISSGKRALPDWPLALGHFGLSDAERVVALRERSILQDWIVFEPLTPNNTQSAGTSEPSPMPPHGAGVEES